MDSREYQLCCSGLAQRLQLYWTALKQVLYYLSIFPPFPLSFFLSSLLLNKLKPTQITTRGLPCQSHLQMKMTKNRLFQMSHGFVFLSLLLLSLEQFSFPFQKEENFASLSVNLQVMCDLCNKWRKMPDHVSPQSFDEESEV